LPQRPNASIAAIEPTFRKPPRSPNLNAYCERFVRSGKKEALQQMIVIGEASLRYMLQSCLAHYHQERNHQAVRGEMCSPSLSKRSLAIRSRPHAGLSQAMRLISARSSAGIGGRP
jgi:transposase InsO family protein